MKRLDRLLSEAGVCTRSEASGLLKSGRVTVNGVVVRAGAEKVEESARIALDGTPIRTGSVTLLMYKPAGVISATRDETERTVLDILPPPWRGRALFPVGRLDKETEGLLLLTEDGALAHALTSPRHEVKKVYLARTDGIADEEDAAAFAAGITLRDGTLCRPAELEVTGTEWCRVTLTEGRYHQVRRMLAARGKPVVYLRRERESFLTLEGLAPGEVRELTARELSRLRGEL